MLDKDFKIHNNKMEETKSKNSSLHLKWKMTCMEANINDGEEQENRCLVMYSLPWQIPLLLANWKLNVINAMLSPMCSQLYITEGNSAVEERLQHDTNSKYRRDMMIMLTTILDRMSSYAVPYKHMHDVVRDKEERAAASGTVPSKVTGAQWHLSEYKMHDKSHCIVRLALHLSNQQPVNFRKGNHEAATEFAAEKDRMLTAYFK